VCSAIGVDNCFAFFGDPRLSNGTFAKDIHRSPFQITYDGGGLRAERQQCEVRSAKQVEKSNPS